MKEITAGIIAFIVIAVLVVGFSALMAWVLSWGIAFVSGWEIGFWRTLVGMYVLSAVSNIAFVGLRVRNTKED